MGLAVFFPGVLFKGQELYLRDLSLLIDPMRTVLINTVRSGGWPPLWNEYFAGGQPLAANPHFGAFHPLALQFLVLPWLLASALQVLVPVVGTFLGMYVLLRQRSCSGFPALIGALSWAFGGVMLSLANLLPMLWTLAPLPFAVAFADSVARGWIRSDRDGATGCADTSVRGGRWWSCLGFSASIGLIVIGGEPTSILICAFAVSPSVIRGIRADPAAASRRLLLSVGLGLGLSACVLLPAVGLVSKTDRAAVPTVEPRQVWSLPPIRLAELLTPPAYPWPSDDTASVDWHQALYPSFKMPLLASLYPGFLIGILFVSGSVTSPRVHLRELGLAAVAVVLAIGSNSPVWQNFSHIPLIRVGRYPEKWAVLVCFCVVVIGSQTLQRFWRGTARERALIAGTSICVACVVALGWSLFLRSTAGDDLLDSRVCASTGLALGALALMGVMMAGLRPVRRWRHAACAGVLILTFSDLAVCGKPLVPTRSIESSSPMPSAFAPAVPQASEYRMFHLASLRSTPSKEPWMGPPPAPARWGLRTLFEGDYDCTQLTWTVHSWKAYLDLMAERPDLSQTLLAQVGVASVVELVGPSPHDPDVWGIVLSRIPNPAPIVSCVDAVSVISSPSAWKKAVVEHFDASSGRLAVVERPLGPVPRRPDGCVVDSFSTNPTHVTASVRGRGPGPSVVRVNQTWDLGWQARIDGEPVELMRCDIAFAAVVVPAGSHVLELSYHDPLVTIGLVISVSSALIVMFWAGLLVRRAVP